MTFIAFNELEKELAAKELFSCCGSDLWVSRMMENFPFNSEGSMVNTATAIWYDTCTAADWLQSFTHHPRIGDINSLKERFAGKEQAGVATASDGLIQLLANTNAAYEEKFGFIFIVCATGKTAAEMLALLQARLQNKYAEELNIAMGEQHKITIIRFKKLLTDADFKFLKMSQLTTHVLDTSIGKPGRDITIRLMNKANNDWQTMAQGITDADGRISDLLAPGKILPPAVYKLVFETGHYFAVNKVKGFYPEVEIQFTVVDDTHYHVPLLINPFGYSTYRGS